MPGPKRVSSPEVPQQLSCLLHLHNQVEHESFDVDFLGYLPSGRSLPGGRTVPVRFLYYLLLMAFADGLAGCSRSSTSAD